MSLPENKRNKWTTQIVDILKSNKSNPSNFDSLIGRLNHVAFIIPIARNFMNRLRNLHSKLKNRRHMHLASEVKRDLCL